MKTLKPIWLTGGIIIDKVNTRTLTMPMGRERHLNYCRKKGEKAIPLTTDRGGSVLAEI